MKKLFIILAALGSFLTVIAFDNPVGATKANDHCIAKYKTIQTPLYTACVNGYSEGDEANPICDKFNQDITHDGKKSTSAQLKEACRYGYGKFKADTQSCRGDLDECIDDLREYTLTPVNAIRAAAPPTTDGGTPIVADGGKRVGPAPQDAKINKQGRQIEEGEKDRSERCAVQGFFGTIVCGITNVLSKVTDASYSLLTVFLETKPLMTTTGNDESATYTAWKVIRDIANIVVIVGLLAVIFAYTTNQGLANYDIKKMLPRIISAGLLINFSFFICAAAIDLSNIGGTYIKEGLGLLAIDKTEESADSIAYTGLGREVDESGNPVNQDDQGRTVPTVQTAAGKEGGGTIEGEKYSTWTSVAGVVMMASLFAIGAYAIFIHASMAVLYPLLASAAITILTVVIILMLRQVLLVLFVVISPLAFAANVLPTTASLFEKWRKAFFPIIMLFPSVSFIYGMSAIVSGILIEVAAATSNNPTDGFLEAAGSPIQPIVLTIAALAVQVIPLALTPMLMRLGGGLLSRYGGMARDSGLAGRLRKTADDKSEHSANKRDAKALAKGVPDTSEMGRGKRALGRVRNARSRSIQKRYEREHQDKELNDVLNQTRDEQFREALEDESTDMFGRKKGEKLQKDLAQSADKDKRKNALNREIHAKAKGHAKAVQAKSSEIDALDRNDALAAATGAAAVSEIAQEAAILRLGKSGDVGAMIAMLKASGNMTHQQRRALVGTIDQKAIAAMPFLGDANVQDAILQGNVNDNTFLAEVVAKGMANPDVDLSPSAMTNIDADATAEIVNAINTLGADKLGDGTIEAMADSADKALNDEELSTKISQTQGDLETMRAMKDAYINRRVQ